LSEKTPVSRNEPLLLRNHRTAITTNGGSKGPGDPVAVEAVHSSPSATRQAEHPCGNLRKQVSWPPASRATAADASWCLEPSEKLNRMVRKTL